MASKQNKKQQEEFLGISMNAQHLDPDVEFQTKEVVSDHYLGPLFFGGCIQKHPPHSVPQSGFHSGQQTTHSEENILEDLFLPLSTVEEKSKINKPIPRIHFKKRKKSVPELHIRQHVGVRRCFVHDVNVGLPDLGETESEIHGEACREIPVCRVVSSSSMPQQFELISPSDVTERNRPFMPYNERIAHTHFLKEFVTVRVIGPKIPAPIKITKLPTKRKKLSDFNFVLPSKKSKTEEVPEPETKEEMEAEGENEETIEETSAEELIEPKSIEEVLDETHEGSVLETVSEPLTEEDNYKEDVVEDKIDQTSVYHEEEEEDAKSIHSNKQEGEIEEQIETEVKIVEKEEGEKLEDETPTEENQGNLEE